MSQTVNILGPKNIVINIDTNLLTPGFSQNTEIHAYSLLFSHRNIATQFKLHKIEKSLPFPIMCSLATYQRKTLGQDSFGSKNVKPTFCFELFNLTSLSRQYFDGADLCSASTVEPHLIASSCYYGHFLCPSIMPIHFLT